MAKNSVIILIRHAEKPEVGQGLAPEGVKRADAYVRFFSKYHAGARPLTVDALFAAADTKASFRPRLTLTPLSQALHLPIQTEYEDKQTDALAQRLLSKEFDGKNVIVCWKHGQIVALAKGLIGDPAALPKQAHWPETWPEDQYDWILQVVHGEDGSLDVANTFCVRHPALE